MRYDDLSQADLSTDVTVARADVDGLPNGVMGPAIGNTITGSDTITGQAGADSVANPPATIVAVQGAGASSAEADGSFVVTGQYGVLTIQADGSYSYVRNAGAPDGLDDVFTYTLADAAGQRSSSTLTIELGIQTPSDAASATLSAIPGVVTLPPGVELSDIRVVGRDLVVTLPDGSQMVIPGGAVFVPQLVIGDVEVPASNLAALLIDSEPQPAAGPPLSSGGNFAIDVPPLDPGVPLGDLLPPTELTFIPPEFEEPGQFIDEEPEAGITAAQLDDDEQPGGIAGGVGDDPGGSSDSGILPGSGGDGDLTWDLLTTGAPAGFSYADGPNGSILVFQDGNPNAVLSITLDAATGAYTATQLGPITHPVGSDENNVVITINYTVTDEDGDTAPGSLTINVDDDTPIARDDTDSVPEGADSTDGNVITGTGTTSGASGADSGGADGIPDGVIGIRAGTSGNFTTVTGAGTTVSGTFGDLTIHADGSYTYALHEGTEGGGTDVFTYQIIDGDGDPDTATLTITVPDQNDPPIVDGSTINVSEEGLADGNPDSDGTPDTTDDASVSGTITINDPDGDPVTVTLGIPAGAYTSNGVPIVWAVSPDGHTLTGTAGANLIVTVTIDNTGAYDVVLSGPFDHSDPTIEDALSFTVPVSVDDGTAPPVGTTIVVTVEDDSPEAGVGEFSVPEIVLDESPVGEDEGGDSDPVGRSSVTVDLSGAFVTPADYGADGAGSVAYALVLTGTDVGSGLFALDPLAVDGKGDEILLNQDPVTGVITGSAGGTDYFTISVDATTGEVTFAQTNNVWHADTASDDDTSFLTVDAGVLTLEQTVTDADGDTDSASVDLGDDIFQIEDDGPSLSEVGAGAGVTLDETDAGDITGFPISATSLTAAITAVAAFGTDGAGATSYGLAIVGDGSTSLQTAQGDHAITLVQIDGDTIEGQYADGGTQVAFTIDINADGTITVTQEVPLEHLIDGDTPADHDDTLDLAGLVDATITVTDADGDSETGSAAIGVNIIFHDDGPDAGTDGRFSVPEIVLDESPVGEDEGGDSDPVGRSSVTVDLSGAFVTPADYGADGAGSVAYALVLTGTDVGSGLFALDPLAVDGKGDEILLNQDPVTGVITGSAGGTDYFTISVDATTGEVTFAQTNNVWHADTASDDDTSFLTVDAGVLTLEQTVTDADGDTDSASVDLGDDIFQIEDDGPSLSEVGAGAGVTLDETDAGDITGFPISATSLTAAITAVAAFGTDGAGATSYGLAIVGDGSTSLQTAQGDHAITLVQIDGDTIEGQYADGGTQVAFTIDINADGTITVTQEVPLEHLIDGDTPADHDDTLDLAGLVDATITVTDADGDSETGSAAIGVNIIFHDDGPEAGVDGEFDTPQLVVDESPLGEDEGGDSTPAGVSTASADFSGAFNASVDYGADGAGSFSYALALSADGAGSGLYALGADGNPGPEILLYDNGDGTISGKIGADVYFTISVDASANVSFEQFLNVYHADTTSDDDTSTLEADAGTITLVQSVTDSDGDTDSASVDLSSGVFSIEDDGPTAISPEAVNVEQGGTVTGELDFGDVDGVDDNYGTDGAGTVRFPSTIDGTDSGLESGGDPIIYDLVDDHTLQGKVGNTVIFTITLDPATSEYTVDLDGVIDSFTDIEFSDGSYDFVGGNDPWAGFVPLGQEAAPQDDNSQDLLLTPFSDVGSGNSINGNANSAGVGGGGGGQNIGAGEGIRLDFVTDLTGNPAGSPANYDGNVAQQDHVFDGHYEVNDVSLRFGDGQTDSTISIEAFDADDSNDLVLGNGDLVNITRIVISYDGENQAVTFDPLNLTQTVTVGVVGGLADRQYTVEWIEDSPGVYHVEVTGILDINVRIATHGETTYEALEVQHLSGDDFAITGFGAATQSTEPVDFQVPVEIVDADGDPEAAMLDVTVYAVGDLPAPFAKLSSQSEESSNLLVSNDNIETHKAMNAGNNAIVLGAVAAAGLMSEPAAASSSARVGGELTGEGQEMTARGDSSVDPQLASSTEANAQLISGETKAELSETTDGTSGSEGSEVQSLSVADAQSGTAAEPGNLDQGTDAPQGNSSLAPTTADAVIMPSAEMLAGVGNAEAAEQAQSNQIVGQVLADSLAGGSGQSEIDAALNQLPGDNEAVAGLEQLATQDAGSVPAWHSADMSGFTAANDLLSMEALMLHPDAAPAASS